MFEKRVHESLADAAVRARDEDDGALDRDRVRLRRRRRRLALDASLKESVG